MPAAINADAKPFIPSLPLESERMCNSGLNIAAEMWARGFGPALWHPDRSQHLPETIFPKQRSNLETDSGLALVVRPTMGFGHVGVHRKSVSRVLPGPFAGNAKVRIIALSHGTVNMKKPIKRPIEQACPACNGTGIVPVKLSARSGVRIYPPRCKECDGKGRAPPTSSEKH